MKQLVLEKNVVFEDHKPTSSLISDGKCLVPLKLRELRRVRHFLKTGNYTEPLFFTMVICYCRPPNEFED